MQSCIAAREGLPVMNHSALYRIIFSITLKPQADISRGMQANLQERKEKT
jgi:hypothetical protein